MNCFAAACKPFQTMPQQMSRTEQFKVRLPADRGRDGMDLVLEMFLIGHFNFDNPLKIRMVGLARFELTTSCTPCKRSTKLSYSP